MEGFDLRDDVKEFVLSQRQLDLVSLVNWLGPQIEQRFVRKHFRDFDYLSVEPPIWAIIVTYAVSLSLTIGLSVWAVRNEYTE